MKVDLFVPCFIDQLYPTTAMNVVKLLNHCGIEVNFNPSQTCCGQPAFNSGYWNEARALAYKFLDDFKNSSLIVGPSASCTAYIKNYYHRLFENDPVALATFSLKKQSIFELSDFLVNIFHQTTFGSKFPHKVTYHDSCAALREYGIRREPRILLNQVEGIELIEMNETEVCCGFGGTFAAKFTAISAAMTHQKIEFALQTGAEYIVSTEASCLMNIESYIFKNNIPLKIIHLADVLASGID